MSRSALLTLLRHAWARHRLPLILIAVAGGLFQFLLTRIAPSPSEVTWLGSLIPTLPSDIQRLIGSEVALSSGGFLAFGYRHPFFVILLSVWVVRVSSAAVAGEVGRGSMDLLAARPVARWHFVVVGMIAIGLGLALIVGTAWLGTAIGLQFRALNVDSVAFWPVALSVWLLFAAWGAVGLAASSTLREGGQAIAWTTAILAVSFVFDYLARLWTPIARFRPLSLFQYYEPQSLLATGVSQTALVVLGLTMVFSLAVAVLAVQRRDL